MLCIRIYRKSTSLLALLIACIEPFVSIFLPIPSRHPWALISNFYIRARTPGTSILYWCTPVIWSLHTLWIHLPGPVWFSSCCFVCAAVTCSSPSRVFLCHLHPPSSRNSFCCLCLYFLFLFLGMRVCCVLVPGTLALDLPTCLN